MIKVKEIRIETLEELLEMQNTLLEENENYTFRIKIWHLLIISLHLHPFHLN